MQRDVAAYFEQTVIPLVADKYPDVASEMSIQILGSYGLGIADEFSDLDSVLWLEDDLWKAQGGKVQLMLERLPEKFAPTDLYPGHYHPEICVWPLSWLRHRREFLEDKQELPWELVTFEELFELQENLVLRDPQDIFKRLKAATAPERFPGWLWRKRLIQELKKLGNDCLEIQQVIKRHRVAEAHIILGRVLEDLLHLGFIVRRRYYPWSTHLGWAFGRLPEPAPSASPHIEAAASSRDWNEKLTALESVREIYAGYITENDILSPQILENILWAERLEAWSNPGWHEDVVRCERKATEAGVHSRHGWIWSLWGWQ